MARTGGGATKQWPYGAVAAMVPTSESRQKRRGWVAGGADGWGRGSWPDGVRTGRGAAKQGLTALTAMARMGGAGRSGAAERVLAGHHRTGGAGPGPAVVGGGLLCGVVGRKKISKETDS